MISTTTNKFWGEKKISGTITGHSNYPRNHSSSCLHHLKNRLRTIFKLKTNTNSNSWSTSAQHQWSSEESDLWIIRTSVFFLVEEGLAQDVPCGLVKLLQVQLPAIRLQVFQDLLHRAEICHGFTHSLHAVQSRGYDSGRSRLLRKSTNNRDHDYSPSLGIYTISIICDWVAHYSHSNLNTALQSNILLYDMKPNPYSIRS